MTDFQDQQPPQQPYYPPQPPYAPSQPITTEPGTTIWPSGGHVPPPPAGPPAAATAAAGAVPGSRRRAKRGVGLLAAVAIAAAAVGGGTATLVQQLSSDSPVTASSVVNGTNVSASSVGTVAGVAQAVSPSIVEISASSNSGKSTGSGVIITSDGEIVTNNHVISGASSISVQLSDGKTYEAEVVGTDPDKDLALIKLQGASGLKAATLGDSSKVKVGEEVVAIGSPEGLTGTVTSGIVSALDRDVTVAKDDDSGSQDQQQGQQYDPRQGWPFEFGGQQFNGDTGTSKTTYKAIQTDASLNPGNSGGALINMKGEIIGINSAMYSPSSSNGSTAGSVGLGFAIPVDTVKADLDSLRAGGDS
ncbi:trypsin-like peptidase domain-containing protein [Streptomyces gardneri]|uniref:S1C family serine protease n=1 Tax=Streptomyces gardneri TaxID=66892 RepID=UPI0006E2E186|nr:trypsin-like peptidase domain-containing protein [Streptomyces gardneri]QPK46970.1 trypsin-like peptidase domain-containing protein [Streptomyces gardneri]WRK38385.1 trypsin-like peptidase domain-containing protein [Streptomyces venezuelae]